jgi:hypothetical protein
MPAPRITLVGMERGRGGAGGGAEEGVGCMFFSCRIFPSSLPPSLPPSLGSPTAFLGARGREIWEGRAVGGAEGGREEGREGGREGGRGRG